MTTDNKRGRLQDKVALITGGNSGIGLATAKQFVAEGAFVYITGRRQKELDEATKSIGTHVKSIRGDVSVLADIDNIYRIIKSEQGRLDILFANAGSGTLTPLGSITEAQFDKEFGTNVKGTLFTVQKALPLMSSGASVILNASITSVKGFPAFSVYSATKAAIRSFARTWITDLRSKGIRVNVVSPGTVPTPGYDNFGFNKDQMNEFLLQQSALIPLGRVGTPDEIARAVVFLASEDSSYVNGIELFVDGGFAQV